MCPTNDNTETYRCKNKVMHTCAAACRKGKNLKYISNNITLLKSILFKNSRQSYFEDLWYEIFWDMFLGQKWIIWTIFDTWQTFLGFSGAILDPYFTFLLTLSQKIVIFIKNQRFHFFTVMILGWLQWLGRAKILSFRRIWAHITKCLLWKCVIWGPLLSFLT